MRDGERQELWIAKEMSKDSARKAIRRCYETENTDNAIGVVALRSETNCASRITVTNERDGERSHRTPLNVDKRPPQPPNVRKLHSGLRRGAERSDLCGCPPGLNAAGCRSKCRCSRERTVA